MAATKQEVAKIVTQAVAQRRSGDSSWECAGVVFDLEAGGYCARLVRQAFEAAIGLGEWMWAYKAATAYDMEALLRDAGLRTDSPMPGDIVCVNSSGTRPGHIGIYLGYIDGVESYAENTSCATRGDPREAGTKITPLSAIASRITGYYAALPSAVPVGYEVGDIRVACGDDGVPGWFTGDHAIVGVTALADLIGDSTSDFIDSARTVAIRPGYKQLGKPMPRYPGHAPGPITVATGGGNVDGWLTAGANGHAVVGVSAIAAVLGYDVDDRIVAAREVVLRGDV